MGNAGHLALGAANSIHTRKQARVATVECLAEVSLLKIPVDGGEPRCSLKVNLELPIRIHKLHGEK